MLRHRRQRKPAELRVRRSFGIRPHRHHAAAAVRDGEPRRYGAIHRDSDRGEPRLSVVPQKAGRFRLDKVVGTHVAHAVGKDLRELGRHDSQMPGIRRQRKHTRILSRRHYAACSARNNPASSLRHRRHRRKREVLRRGEGTRSELSVVLQEGRQQLEKMGRSHRSDHLRPVQRELGRHAGEVHCLRQRRRHGVFRQRRCENRRSPCHHAAAPAGQGEGRRYHAVLRQGKRSGSALPVVLQKAFGFGVDFVVGADLRHRLFRCRRELERHESEVRRFRQPGQQNQFDSRDRYL